MRLRHDEDSVVRILVDGQRGSNPQVLLNAVIGHVSGYTTNQALNVS